MDNKFFVNISVVYNEKDIVILFSTKSIIDEFDSFKCSRIQYFLIIIVCFYFLCTNFNLHFI